MIWRRDEARPTRYNGVLFRSALEAKVAEELDGFGIEWAYERTTDYPLDYLPDFDLGHGQVFHAEFDLPTWIEVKPAGLLYALRDHVDCPERFDDIRTAIITAQQIRAAGLDEIWKPKRLAELAKDEVLVVSAINRTRTLSILMVPEGIELSKSNPLVNYRQVVAERERAEREARWRAELDAKRAEYEAQQAQARAETIAYARAHGRPARYDGWCCVCSEDQFASDLVIFRTADGRWAAVCADHLRKDGT